MSFISRKSVEQIVKPITKIVSELNNYAAQNQADSERHAEEAARRASLAVAAAAEHDKAITAAGKISSLIG